MDPPSHRGPADAGEPTLTARMSALWEAARFKDAAAIYDTESSEKPTPEAMILRARAYLKSGEAPAAIGLLERTRPGRASFSVRRSKVLAMAHALIGNYAVADELFDEAARAASRLLDAELMSDVAYSRAHRHLFERRVDRARPLLPQVHAVAKPFCRIRALHLESAILNQEGRHHEQAHVLLDLLACVDPNRTDYMEIRAWATQTLAGLARELYLPEALPEIERQLGGVDWSPDLNDQRFQALKGLGWACALRGDHFNAFRLLRLCSRYATTNAWRSIAAADRAELARCMGEHLWSRQELAQAEGYAANVNWAALRDEARLGLLLLAQLFVPIDAAKAAYYQARFSEYEDIKAANFHLKNDPRLAALAQYSAAIVDLSGDHRKIALDMLKEALETFRTHAYAWRAGRCALRLFAETRDVTYLSIAGEQLRDYMGCWLGDELRALAGSAGENFIAL